MRCSAAFLSTSKQSKKSTSCTLLTNIRILNVSRVIQRFDAVGRAAIEGTASWLDPLHRVVRLCIFNKFQTSSRLCEVAVTKPEGIFLLNAARYCLYLKTWAHETSILYRYTFSFVSLFYRLEIANYFIDYCFIFSYWIICTPWKAAPLFRIAISILYY